MPQAVFEHTIPVFVSSKTEGALDRTATDSGLIKFVH